MKKRRKHRKPRPAPRPSDVRVTFAAPSPAPQRLPSRVLKRHQREAEARYFGHLQSKLCNTWGCGGRWWRIF